MRKTMRCAIWWLALVAAVGVAATNVFIMQNGLTLTIGEPFEIEWVPSNSHRVSMYLAECSSNRWLEGDRIAESIPNGGSIIFIMPGTLNSASEYAFKMVSDDDGNEVDYSPPFAVKSPVTATPEPSTFSTKVMLPRTDSSQKSPRPTESAAKTDDSDDDDDDDDDGGGGLSTGEIIGIVFGVLIGLSLLMAICCRCGGRGGGAIGGFSEWGLGGD